MEISRLSAVYRYFENLTGNRGITLLLVGGLGGEIEQASRLLVARGDVVALKAVPSGAKDPDDEGERMFASMSLRPRIEAAGVGTSTTPRGAYVILTTGK